MNLLLLREEDFLEDGRARVTGRRLEHAREILRAAKGECLRVGLLGGRLGTAEVLVCDERELHLKVEFHEKPPPRAGVTLLLALPRPKALKKILPAAASLGVDRIVLINAARVERSYFASPVLGESEVAELFALGLEQARDTVAPELLVRDRFRPFVEDELGALLPTRRLLAHPGAEAGLVHGKGPVALAIGPEGGWVPFEVELPERCGFRSFTLGPRILRVEVAVSFLLGALLG